MKRSIVLLELIVSLLLFAIVAVGSSKMIYTMVQNNKDKSIMIQNNLLLETTRVFLSKQEDLTKISYDGLTLKFEANLLLENVSKYEVSTNGDIIKIDICLLKDSVCQKWTLKF